MTREEVFEHVKGMLVETLSVDEDKVTMEARFQEDLETDSLDLVELVMTMEEKFDIKISDAEAAQIKTVGDAVDFVIKTAGAYARPRSRVSDIPTAITGGPAGPLYHAAGLHPHVVAAERVDSYERLEFLGDSVLS